jgi:hypothetical protein
MAPPDVSWLIMGIIKVLFCYFVSQNTSLTKLELYGNQFFFFARHATRFFFLLIMGIIKGCLSFICSQNKTLQALRLSSNKIGVAGAASIGGALAYVTVTPCECNFLQKDISFAPPIFFG